LAPKYDLLIVSIHGGREGGSAQHVKNEAEYFLGESRGNLVKFAHNAIDRGAHLVLGHGPHVPRALEIYKERLIAYSLGNFCTYKGMNLDEERGYAPLLWVEVNKTGKFLRGKIHSFLQVRPGGPKPDEQSRAFKLMKTLSLEDFPESSPLFVGADTIIPLAATRHGEE
jgi:poly-gamma-glutamate capsule biosynthesis protein CapA/YwtB (metallophosphatase superfamily)